jgi:branched-chain amino acid transport system substrate-binding protein
MKLKLMATALAALMAAGPALADLTIPLISFRTGPYAANGIPIADGYTDYLTLINERDGGIGGEKIKMPECESGYNTEKGVECYEATKENAILYQPVSTGLTYQLIPKVTADHIPLHSIGHGRTSVANGAVFKWVFNYPTNYWAGASVAIKYLLQENGGDLKGKKITLVHHNSAFGKEPIPTLEVLAEKHEFVFNTLAVDHPGQEQKSQWLQIRRNKPDYVLLWGWGVMNPVALQEAANVRFPLENVIGVWWSGSESDVLPGGESSDGYKALAMHAPGSDFGVYEDLKTYVYDKGLAAGNGDQMGTVLYNRGLYSAMLAVEAVKNAQEIHGISQVTAPMVRDGMEALNMTEEKMASLGFANFAPEIKVTCANHGGQGLAAVRQWNAKTKSWVMLTDFIAPDSEVVDPLIAADSFAYAAEAGIEPRCN